MELTTLREFNLLTLSKTWVQEQPHLRNQSIRYSLTIVCGYFLMDSSTTLMLSQRTTPQRFQLLMDSDSLGMAVIEDSL